METPSTNTKPIPSHGRNSKRKESRPNKPLKRTSTLSNSINSRGIPSTSSTVKDKEAMAASFLQYCAMCEKQIMTPSNSLLYCSEACRRKDSVKPLSASLLRPASDSLPSPPRPTLHMRSLSALVASHKSSSPPVLRIPPDMHGHKSDLDPTEWKPKLGNGHRKTSEAFRYLSQFHQNMNNTAPAATIADATMTTLTRSDTPSVMETKDGLITNKNVHYNIGATTSSTSASTPSLTSASMSATPTTGPSSFDSTIYAHIHNYSNHKTHDHGNDRDHDYDYDFNLRPLPPRQNPLYYSTSVGAGRGIDLVTPHVAPGIMAGESAASSMPTYDHDFWGKKKVVTPATTGAGRGGQGGISSGDGLGALFGKAA